MATCRHKGCRKKALYKSVFCWEHHPNKERYRKRILQRDEHGKILLLKANLNCVDLKGAYLVGAYLRFASLRKANLEGAGLMGADLIGANLEGANLSGANLEGAKLVDAKMQKSILAETLLGWANLSRANLTGSYLNKAEVNRANLREAIMREANLQRAGLYKSNLIEADLQSANLVESFLTRADFEEANLCGANLERADLWGAKLWNAKLKKANLAYADLRNAYLNEAVLKDANLTGAKVWGLSLAGCKTEGIKAEYLNFDKDGEDSGIVRLNKEQVEDFFSAQPTIEILLQNKLPPYAIRTLVDLIDKINEQNPDWGVELRRAISSSFQSEVRVHASRDEILEKLAMGILSVFDKRFEQKLLEYLPDKTVAKEHALILKELGEIKEKIDTPFQRITIIKSTGQIPVNIDFREAKVRDIKIFGNVGKMINVEGSYYEISAPAGREDLIRNLLNQLDSPEINKKIKKAEVELKDLSSEQVKFLEKQFKKSIEKIFKEKQKEVGFFDKVKAFTQRFGESVASGVISSAIWQVIQKSGLLGI